MITVNWNVILAEAPPFVIVAVSVTAVVVVGRTTVPDALTIAGWSELQLIVLPLAPAVGKVTLCVTLDALSPLA